MFLAECLWANTRNLGQMDYDLNGLTVHSLGLGLFVLFSPRKLSLFLIGGGRKVGKKGGLREGEARLIEF